MRKRILSGTLALLLLLSTVCLRAETRSVPENLYDDSVVRSVSKVIYCLSDDRNRLVPEVRSVQILSGETLLTVLAGEVLEPSQSDGLISAMSERASFCVLSVTQTGRVATVDLGGEAELLETYELFCLKAALVNTLVETGLVDYVNVLVCGREVPTNGLPTGTLSRFSEDLQTEWAKYENEGVAALRSSEYSYKRNVTLYFADRDSDLLLAEVRQLTLTVSDPADAVIEALISGPSNSPNLKRSYPSSTQIVGVPSLETEETGDTFLDVSFSYEMAEALRGDTEQRRAALAPLVMTLTSFLPETDAVRVRVNRRPLDGLLEENGKTLYRDQFEGTIGRTMELYFPREDGTLAQVTRAVSQNKCTLRDLIEELFTVPEGMETVFPEGFTSDHLTGVLMTEDTVVVNLSREGAELFSKMDEEQERTCLFAIVNTLTGYDGVSRVQFLVEGRRVSTLSGNISVHAPLVRNPGIVTTSGH